MLKVDGSFLVCVFVLCAQTSKCLYFLLSRETSNPFFDLPLACCWCFTVTVFLFVCLFFLCLWLLFFRCCCFCGRCFCYCTVGVSWGLVHLFRVDYLEQRTRRRPHATLRDPQPIIYFPSPPLLLQRNPRKHRVAGATTGDLREGRSGRWRRWRFGCCFRGA